MCITFNPSSRVPPDGTTPRSLSYLRGTEFEEKLQNYPDCLTFLIQGGQAKNKAMNAIAGFANMDTTLDKRFTGLQFDTDGHPLIRVEGSLVRWEFFEQRFELTSWGEIYEKNTTPPQVWTYSNSELGFTPTTRYDWGEGARADYRGPQPIHTLNTQEYSTLLAHAQEFYETMDPSKTAVIQLVSSNHEQNNSTPALWEDATLFFCHFSLRIIKEDGKVYSFGLEKDGRYTSGIPVRSDTITVPGSLNQFDYEEFRTYKTDQLVTSIPITMEKAKEVMDEMTRIQRDLRFCFIHQNCSSVAAGFMEEAGVEMPQRRSIPLYLWSIIAPDLTKLPLIGPLIGKVYEFAVLVFSTIWHYTPSPIQWAVTFTVEAVLYIPKKIFVVVFNTLLLAGGISHQGPLPEGFIEESLTPDLAPKNFSQLIRSPFDLFDDNIATVFHSQFLVNWQKAQKTSIMHRHTGRPLLRLMPEYGVRV